MEFNKGIVSGKGFELVGSGFKLVASFFGNLLSNGFSKSKVGVESSSYCSATLGELTNLRQFSLDSFDSISNLLGISTELLA